MKTASKASLHRIACVGVLLLSLSVTACGGRPDRAALSATPEATPAVTASATLPSQPATSVVPPSGVDAAGAAIGTSLTVGSAKKAAKGGIPRPANSAAENATVKYVHESEGAGKVTSVHVRAMTQDKKGRWWVLVDITDTELGKNEAVMVFDGKSWDNMVFGEGISNDDLPPDVRF